jgi:serine/threonine protein kinase
LTVGPILGNLLSGPAYVRMLHISAHLTPNHHNHTNTTKSIFRNVRIPDSESGYSSDEDCFFRDELIRLKKSFRVRGLLRKTAHGDIYLATTRYNSNRVLFLKLVKKRKTTTTFLNGRRVPNEAKIHCQAYQADPVGTVAYLDCFERVADFVIAMEKPTNSLDLLEFVNEYGQLDIEMAQSIATQLGRSPLLYKQVNISHCDLKDENVMFNPSVGC